LEHLYQGIPIPQNWLGRQRIHDRFQACLDANQRAFAPLWPARWMTACLHQLEREETIDFGLLDEGFQTAVIDMVRRFPARRMALLERNPFLNTLFSNEKTSDLTALNRERVLALYPLGRYRATLLETYARILTKPVQQAIDRRALLAGFLNFRTFSLLKWSPFRA
jgi:hypothetical protein